MNSSFKSYYDILMVSRSASPAVISAAYRALSKHLHPDVNRGDPNAERVMRIVNASYEVLSDPIKRRAHDEWIRVNETEEFAGETTGLSQNANAHRTGSRAIGRHLSNFWAIYVFAGFLAVGYFVEKSPPAPSGLPEYVPNPSVDTADAQPSVASVAPSYVRPDIAPNGNAWPLAPAYVGGYSISRADGLSKLTIDNQSNSTDMFVKLVALDTEKTVPIRHAYVPAYQSFTMNKIRAGKYDIRYMDLSDGSLSRSEAFDLQEIRDDIGVQFSVTTMTLYKVTNGNMQTYPLSPNEF